MLKILLEKAEQANLENILYVVATPIGNLSDITVRAVMVLKKSDYIFAEDTRLTNNLLKMLGIQNKLISLREHNEQTISQKVIEYLQQGKIVSQVCDAGTPSICDPGAIVVKNVRNAGYKICPIPGCCALVAALSASGINAHEFYFGGFLPAKTSEKIVKLQMVHNIVEPLVFYESPHRIRDTLSLIAQVMKDRNLILIRELTKVFETFLFGTADDLMDALKKDIHQNKGEMVLIFDRVDKIIRQIPKNIYPVIRVLLEKFPPRQTASIVAELTQKNKNEIYELIINQIKER